MTLDTIAGDAPVIAAAPTIAALPALGAPLDEGIFAGLTTKPDGMHCAVVLLPGSVEAMRWQQAMAFADKAGGELPSRPVAALLYANLKREFEPRWYWTGESYEDDGSHAWYQGFYDGRQSSLRKSYEGRARAVRLIPLSA